MRHGRKPRGKRADEIVGGTGEAAPVEIVAEELPPAEGVEAAQSEPGELAVQPAPAEMIAEPVADVPAEEPAPAPEPAPTEPPISWDDDTAVRRRLAGIYLRTGSLAAAGAELEALGGRSLLEGEGLLDLAEVRWRTGDRAGAGQAAGTYLDAGGSDGLAFVIVAEAAAEAGRQDEARGHLAEAVARMTDLVRAYAGMRSFVELDSAAPAVPAPTVVSARAVEPTPTPDWFAPLEEPSAEEPPPTSPAAPVPEPTQSTASEPPPAVDPEVAAGSAVLAAGYSMLAAVHFGVALRTGPGSAEAVLQAIGDHHEAALELVRGDALRLLGRDDEAALAYQSAAESLTGSDANPA
jgi:hypothetical protein